MMTPDINLLLLVSYVRVQLQTFYNRNGAYLRSRGVVNLSDAQLDSRTARNIWEKFHQVWHGTKVGLSWWSFDSG